MSNRALGPPRRLSSRPRSRFTFSARNRTTQRELATASTLRSARLDLVPLSAEALQALIAGDIGVASDIAGVALSPDLASRSYALLNLRLGDLRMNPDSGDWLLRAIAVRTADRPMVGLVGFHGPPDITGSVEVGYEIEALHRRLGYATEATGALVRWAFGQKGVRRVTAAIRPDNVGSLGVVRRLGFTAAGSRWDAIDGTALLFERRSAPATPQPPTADGGKMPQQAGR